MGLALPQLGREACYLLCCLTAQSSSLLSISGSLSLLLAKPTSLMCEIHLDLSSWCGEAPVCCLPERNKPGVDLFSSEALILPLLSFLTHFLSTVYCILASGAQKKIRYVRHNETYMIHVKQYTFFLFNLFVLGKKRRILFLTLKSRWKSIS